MFTIATAAASGKNASEAVTRAVIKAKDSIDQSHLIGSIIFASSQYDQSEIASTLQEQLGSHIPFVGSSTAGEITPTGPSHLPSVSLLLFCSDTVTCKTALVEEVSGNEVEKGIELGKKLQEQVSDIAYCTIHSDGLQVNPNGILGGLSSQLPDTIITGGSSGDDGAYKQTYQYHNGTAYSNAVCALALSGPIKVSVGVRHGWNPISGPRTVTKSDGQLVHTIDNKPAIALYEEFLGEEEAENLKEVTLAKVALSYPVGMISPDSHEMLLRAPMYVDKNGSITFGGEVPEGSQVQLMIGSKEEAVKAAGEAAVHAMSELNTTPAGALIYSCHVRDTLYASRDEANLEIVAIQSAIGPDTPIAGFYTYAEQAPVAEQTVNLKTCNSLTHNETIVTVLFAESYE